MLLAGPTVQVIPWTYMYVGRPVNMGGFDEHLLNQVQGEMNGRSRRGRRRSRERLSFSLNVASVTS